MLICLCALVTQTLFATRPTVHVSNIAYSTLHCNSVTLTWTNGNGKARLIVVKEGSAPTFVPADGSTYIPNAAFGHSLQYITGNYVVFNTNNSNVAKIDSLKPGKTYYFTIYDHDNNGSLTEYYSNGAPTFSVATYSSSLDFSITCYDSCQAHNSYRFINTSKSTIPGIQYYFDLGDQDTSFLDTAFHSYKKSGLVPVRLHALTDRKGCQILYKQPVRVFQKKVVFFDFGNPKSTDTVQAFYHNLFKMYTGNYTNPLSGSYGYRWFTETDTSIFSFFSHSYDTDGIHRVSLEVTTNIANGAMTQSTGCKDTISFDVRVLNDALKFMQVMNGSTQALDTNLFIFSNTDQSIISRSWLFGDGGSSFLENPTHTYGDTGTYTVTLKAQDKAGNYHEKSITVKVIPFKKTSIRTARIGDYRIYPNPSAGIVTIDMGTSIKNISVYTMLGIKVLEYHANGAGTIELDLSGLDTGNYMLYIDSTSGSFSQIMQLE
jgi:PKD repeat protein